MVLKATTSIRVRSLTRISDISRIPEQHSSLVFVLPLLRLLPLGVTVGKLLGGNEDIDGVGGGVDDLLGKGC